MAKTDSMTSHKKYTGVLWRESNTKRYGGRPDRCYYIKFTDPKTGKQVKKKVGWASEGFTPEIAQKKRTEALEGLHQEEVAEETTLDAFAEKYFTTVSDLKKDHGYNDRNRYKNHLQPTLGARLLTAITLEDLEKLRARLTKDLSPQTVIHVFKLLKAMYNRAIAWNQFNGKNPVAGLKSKPLNNSRVRYLTREEAHRLLDALAPYGDIHDMALLSLGAGLRFGEIAKLQWQDINFDNETALIRDGKGGCDRHAQIKGPVKAMLQRRREATPDAVGYLWVNEKGVPHPFAPRSYEKAVDAIGLNDTSTDAKDRVVFHTLRHTFASWLAIQGTPLYTIQRLMGHKSIKMTERYAHLCPDVQATAVETMLKG